MAPSARGLRPQAVGERASQPDAVSPAHQTSFLASSSVSRIFSSAAVKPRRTKLCTVTARAKWKGMQKFSTSPDCEIRIDTAFSTVMQHCAQTPREGQNGTWIVQSIVDAYTELHQQGHAHSVETWVQGKLVGGLYCVALGRAVFGESMFALQTDASKIALSALVALCKAHDVPQIDCQQATAHLSFMGAREVARADFVRTVRQETARPDMRWRFSPLYWDQLLSPPCP